MKKIRFSPRIALICVVIFFMLPVVVFPDRYVKSVADGLNLFVISVLPAMFPFFFFSKVLSELNFGYDIGLILKKPLKKLYNAPAVSGYILVMSMLCGYPIGAKMVSEFYNIGIIDKKEAKSVSAFCSTSGPLFVVGTVGVSMLQNKTVGFIILLSHYLSAFLNGLIFRVRKSESVSLPAAPKISYDRVLSESMTSSILSVALVGGFVAIFNMASDLLFDLDVIPFFAKLLTFIGVDSRIGEGLFAGIIEVTKGCLILSKSGFDLKIIAPVCAFGITFGGMSVTLQSLTFLGKCKISPFYYLLTKFTQGVIAFFICLGLCQLL